MPTLDDLKQKLATWLDGSGPHSDLVLSSRVRLARNLKGLPFVHYASKDQLAQILGAVRDGVGDFWPSKKGLFLPMDDLSDLDKDFLVERHLISPGFGRDGGIGGVFVGEGEVVSIMVNEEDHLRIQVIQSGFQPNSAWEIADRADDQLSQGMEFFFSERFGFLTACPTNTGTGLRASVLIHLPGLVLTNDINKVLKGVSQVGFVVRGFYGEGTNVLGNLFQISNQTTLGRSEEEIIENLERITRQVIAYEEKARETLIKDARDQIEDKIWRAYGILRNARVLTSQEVMNLLSALRLGLGMGVIGSVSLLTINQLLLLTQPAHLQKNLNLVIDTPERDVERATLVREKLFKGEQDGWNVQ